MIDLWGSLTFYSETGTKGGQWAIQDELYLHDKSGLVEGQCPLSESDYCPVILGTSHQHASYDGLHVLRDNDELWVYDINARRIDWAGVIRLEQHETFTESVFGFWIHSDQEGVDRRRWAALFFEERRARLVRRDT